MNVYEYMKGRYVFSLSLWDLGPAILVFFDLSMKLYDNDYEMFDL